MSSRPSAVFVPVPAAAPVAAAGGASRSRRELEPHVTVLWPFLPAGSLDGATTEALRRLAAGRPRFRASFSRVGRFPGVAFLAPDDPTPFVDLTEAVAGEWPDHPPYEGAYDEVIPHVTIGTDVEVDDARVAALLPLEVEVVEIALAVQRRFLGWRTIARFPLSAS